MDELLFRSSQKLENFQYHVGVATTEGKKAALEFSTHAKGVIRNFLNSPQSVQLQESLRKFWYYILNVADEVKSAVLFHISPRRILNSLSRVFGSKWSKRDVCFGCAGIVIGGLIGIGIGMALHSRRIYRYMQAVQCKKYSGIEGVTVVEDALAPLSCGQNEVLVSVKAGSVQVIDAEICRGYGKTMRQILSSYYKYSKHDLPVTLGRDCCGVIIDVGRNVRRLEVGDEVWLTAPHWGPGTLSQIVLASEHKVGRKPTTVGFESASSLPYAGSQALTVLKKANLNESTALDKRVFVQGGCTPAGCVLIQILKLWGAHVTTSCFKRALPVANALGADDVIVLGESEIKTKSVLNIQLPEMVKEVLVKELSDREQFDVVINTRSCGFASSEFIERGFCHPFGIVVSTLSEEIVSDTYDSMTTSLFRVYMRIKCMLQRLFGYDINDFGETHMCHSMLDELTTMVEDGHVKTLVDKVFHPGDVHEALYHIQSTESIGGTIITFR